MEEIWKDVPGYEGYYKVSSYGNFMSFQNKYKPKQISVYGGQVQLCRGAVIRHVSAKKIIAQAFLNYNGNNRYIKCKDGNYSNLHVDNLYIAEPERIPHEEWKDIKDHEDFQISNMGRIRRKSFYDLYEVDGKLRSRKFDSTVLTPSSDADGYLEIGVSEHGDPYYFRIHRLVAQAFIPNLENLPEVNHKDGNKQNNCVKNLEWVSTADNIRHSIETGLRERRYIGLNRSPVKVRCVEDNLEFSSLSSCANYYSGTPQNLSKAIKCGKKYKGKTFVNVNKEE